MRLLKNEALSKLWRGLLVFLMVGPAPVIYSSTAAAEVRIVGSSTVYPYATVVAEKFGYKTRMPAPVVEATGTGGGFKSFCTAKGKNGPDIVAASRPIQGSEIDLCRKNGIKDLVQIPIGYDAIVMVKGGKSLPDSLSFTQIFTALADKVLVKGNAVENTAQSWQDIDPTFTDAPIKFYGPSATSGTRDSFIEIAMEAGCHRHADGCILQKQALSCKLIRSDGTWIDVGENDNLITRKVAFDKTAYGIFGYSYYRQRPDNLSAVQIEGIEPSEQTITDGSYPLVRRMFFYVDKKTLAARDDVAAYLREFLSEDALGEYGYLLDRGLVAPKAAEVSAAVGLLGGDS